MTKIKVNKQKYNNSKQKMELKKDAYEMKRELGLKTNPSIHVDGNYTIIPRLYDIRVSSGGIAEVHIPNDDIKLFHLAMGMYLLHIKKTGEIDRLSRGGIYNQAMGYAIAVCRRKAQREGRGLFEYVPYDIKMPDFPEYIWAGQTKEEKLNRLFDVADYMEQRYMRQGR